MCCRLSTCYRISLILGLCGLIIGTIILAIGAQKIKNWHDNELHAQEQIANVTITNRIDCQGVMNISCYEYNVELGFPSSVMGIIVTHGELFTCFDMIRDCQGDLNQLVFGTVYFHDETLPDYSYQENAQTPYLSWFSGGMITLIVGIFLVCFPCLSTFRTGDCYWWPRNKPTETAIANTSYLAL